MDNNLALNVSKQRQSNIELLRIIVMMLIVVHHFASYGAFTFSTSAITLNRIWFQILRSPGKICTNVFVLISGYFLVEKENLKIKKVLKMWAQIFTYSFLLFVIFACFGGASLNYKMILKRMFPITFVEWWFVSAYFMLYLISPFLNKFLTKLDKKSYQKLIVLTTVCWSIIPTLLTSRFQSNEFIWLVYLYSLSGYIKLHVDTSKIKPSKAILTSVALYALTFLTTIFFDIIGMKIPAFGTGRHAVYFFGMQKFPALLIALFLFMGFLNLNIRYNKIINMISSATFGVYLIHEDRFVRNVLWYKLFSGGKYAYSKLLIPYSIGVVLLVFIVCTGIELFRINIFEKIYMKYIEKLSIFIEDKIKRFFNLKIFDRI